MRNDMHVIDLSAIATSNASALTAEMLLQNGSQHQTKWVALLGDSYRFFKKHTPKGNTVNDNRFLWLLRNNAGHAWAMSRVAREVEALEKAPTLQTIIIEPGKGSGTVYHVKLVDPVRMTICLFDAVKFAAFDLVRCPAQDYDFHAAEAAGGNIMKARAALTAAAGGTERPKFTK